jgi:alpha-L-fucosidase
MAEHRDILSRRAFLNGVLASLVSIGANVGAARAAANDNTTPVQRDSQWLNATRPQLQGRLTWLNKVASGTQGGPFAPNWASLQSYEPPEWYQNARFGIFVHWGVFSVPAYGSEWYSRNMYVQGSPEFEHHIKTYGPQTRFGYKDFIPMFTAEAFNADEWADLFHDAGARYVVPVAEHHDGFSMYDSQLSDYTSVRMGPKRDLIGEIASAVRSRGLHFALSSHRAEHDWFFDEGRKFPSDVSDPLNAGLYGPAQDRIPGRDDQDLFGDYTYVSQAWLDDWLARQAELVATYSPDLVYFDWWIGHPTFRNTLPKFLAWYYNRAAASGGSAIVNYKLGEFADGAGVLDIERGQAPGIRPSVWQTCTSISDKSWGYIENDTYKSPEHLIHLLVDVVSKNGNLLLNVGPKASGEIPASARDTLLRMGDWLQVNGEAIYGARPWIVFGEGPTETASGSFSESDVKPYTSADFRFTTRDRTLYAIQMKRPQGQVTIASIHDDYPVQRVTLLGMQENLPFRLTEAGLILDFPASANEQVAYVYKIETR